ncbi:MAG: DNA-directed RNA polymerase subunit alpha C-terminal domain-containing protein [Planctomycetota bacterium]|jgi:DNA-directed RNA polymerase alpha subunit
MSEQSDQDDRKLSYLLRYLRPSQRVQAACASLGIETVGQFLERDKAEFLALPNFGERSYQGLDQRVESYIHSTPPVSEVADPGDLERPINGIVTNSRALRAFVRLGITTVGAFLATPKNELLAIQGFGERTYTDVVQKIRALIGSNPNHLLPSSLLCFRVYDLGLDETLHDTLSRLGIVNVGDVLRLSEAFMLNEPGIGDEGMKSLRVALDRMLQVGIAQVAGYGSVDLDTFSGFLGQILTILDQGQREILKYRVGLGCQAQSVRQLASRWKVSEEQVEVREDTLRRSLQKRLPAHMMELRRATEAELKAFEGIITGDRLAPGTILHLAAKESRDPRLPLRLASFLFPQEFHLTGEFLSSLAPKLLQSLKKRLRRCTDDRHLPVSVETLESDVRDLVDPVPRELLLHLLRDHLQLSVQIDPKLGEIINRKQGSIADRLQSIIEDLSTPLSLEDLFFHFRDRFQACQKDRLLDEMRKDRRFLQLEREVWSLRERHLDELELLRVEAERISKEIVSSGQRKDVFEIDRSGPGSERAAYLLNDHLRRDPALRYLGRGHFVPRNVEHSTLVQGLVANLRKAMGEIPFSRFLQNQSEGRRRLISALLNRNRLFVSPVPDRVDLLENYPFNQDRLRRLLQATDGCLEENHGYSQLKAVKMAVEEAGLGGGWLSDHLLLDLLARHGRYEFLPGDMVAQASLGLMGWIQQRAREALRLYRNPMTADEVLSERPDLAEFRTSLVTLLEQDPLVQTSDGLHFTVI